MLSDLSDLLTLLQSKGVRIYRGPDGTELHLDPLPVATSAMPKTTMTAEEESELRDRLLFGSG